MIVLRFIILYISVQLRALKYKNMALNIVHYQQENQQNWGVIQDGQVYPLKIEFPKNTTTGQIIALGIEKLKSLIDIENPHKSDEVQFLSPITQDQKVICQGANYRQHLIYR